MRSVPHTLGHLNTWSPIGGRVAEGSVLLWEDTASPTLQFSLFLCFVFVGRYESSQPPPPAAMSAPSCYGSRHNGCSL